MPQDYPSTAALSLFISSCGIIDTAGNNFRTIDLQAKLDAAQTFIETETGRVFKAVSSTRRYDTPTNPKGRIFLGQELAEITSLTINSVALAVDQGFYLGPDNADADGKPWLWLDLVTYAGIPGNRRAVAVTGLWGYSVEVPADVWQAILQQAALLCTPEIALNVSKGLYEWKQGDESERYGGAGDAGPLSGESKMWKAYVEAVIEAKKRVTV